MAGADAVVAEVGRCGRDRLALTCGLLPVVLAGAGGDLVAGVLAGTGVVLAVRSHRADPALLLRAHALLTAGAVGVALLGLAATGTAAPRAPGAYLVVLVLAAAALTGCGALAGLLTRGPRPAAALAGVLLLGPGLLARCALAQGAAGEPTAAPVLLLAGCAVAAGTAAALRA
ncbi:hypothetical protein [Saccharopolyspora cebuensis]|uniref:Uncharacterized protein n=1 Tax=Saccharopolyspora cebuensis TaxID=418759 RepID=A0ABV4CKJ7_9PSEU